MHTAAIGDYGADLSALDVATFKTVTEAEPILSYEKLDNPLKLKEAFNIYESATFTVSMFVKLSITLTLPGSLIPVRIRRIEFQVGDLKMDKVLLGRLFLKPIGFYLKVHLEKFLYQVHDKDIDYYETRRPL